MSESPSGPVGPATPRSPWDPIVGAMANLFLPPVGHLHVGALERGVLLWAISLVLVDGSGIAVARAPSPATVALFFAAFIVRFLVLPLDAMRLAYRRPAGGPRPPWFVYAGTALASLLVFSAAQSLMRTHVLRTYRMPSESMSPTLVVGDYFVADMGAYRSRSPKRGDIVVYTYPMDPRQTFVKRVVGLPEEIIEIRDRRVSVNGEPLSEPQVRHTEDPILPASESPRDNFPATRIQSRNVFVMGDSRENSNDSRFTGTVPIRKLQGKATWIYMSMGPEGVRWERIGKRLDR